MYQHTYIFLYNLIDLWCCCCCHHLCCRAFELRLAEKVLNGFQHVSLEEDSGPQRTTLGGLKRQGKKGTVGTKRTGNATLCKLLHKAPTCAECKYGAVVKF